MPRLIHQKTKEVLAQHIIKADRLPARLQGLLGKKTFPPAHTLWIAPCKSIHTFFMQFAIDLIFASPTLQITRVLTNIAPWKIVCAPLFSNTHSVFEFKSPGLKAQILHKGDQLYVDS